MKGLKKMLIVLLAIQVQVNISCEKNGNERFYTPPVKIIFAVAGDDQVVIPPNDSIILDGTKSYSQAAKIVSYHWQKVGGSGRFSLVNADSAIAIAKNLETGNYEFSLTVKDEGGRLAADTINVYISKGPDTTYVRILEFGTNKALGGARILLQRCTTPGCNSAILIDTAFDADDQGRIKFASYGFRITGGRQAGYWDGQYALIVQSFPEIPYFNQSPLNYCDSIIVRLVPKFQITVHVKDSSGIMLHPIPSDPNFKPYNNIEISGITQSMNPPFEDLKFWPIVYLKLRQYIDTSFQCFVYGNADNIFSIMGNAFLEYAYDYTDSLLYRKTLHIDAATNKVEITY